MAFFIAPNRFLVFVSDPGGIVTARYVKARLEEHGMRVSAGGEPLTVRWDDGPVMYVSITRGPTAKVLASRLAGAASEHEEPFSDFDGYIEVSFDDLDEVLDEITTLIEVQGALQDATGGWVYRAWNQSLSGPNE